MPVGGLTVWPTFASQPDALADLIKIMTVIGVGAAVVGFASWTLFQRGVTYPGRGRGALAGAVAAMLIVPLPLFAWSLKFGIGFLLDGDGLSAVGLLQQLWLAIVDGALTFQQFTKASLGAILGSAGLGWIVAYVSSGESGRKVAEPLTTERHNSSASSSSATSRE